MKLKKYVLLLIFILIGLIFISLYPKIEFYTESYLYMFSYSKNLEKNEDFIELEDETCYDESYSYNKKRNISLNNWEYKNFLFFRWLKVKYKKGNICSTEYLLEESYINKFLNNAIIKENKDNINLSELIKDKEPIVENKRYPWNDNASYIEYVLDGEYKEMYIYINDEELIIIQVGLSDEGPKYIAYK